MAGLRAVEDSSRNRGCVIAAIAGDWSCAGFECHMVMPRPASSGQALRFMRPLFGEILARRRMLLRASVAVSATLNIDGSAHDVVITNMSVCGMGARFSGTAAKGGCVAGYVRLPGCRKTISAIGTIVWVSEEYSTFGVRFSHLTYADRSALKEWVDTVFAETREVARAKSAATPERRGAFQQYVQRAHNMFGNSSVGESNAAVPPRK